MCFFFFVFFFSFFFFSSYCFFFFFFIIIISSVSVTVIAVVIVIVILIIIIISCENMSIVKVPVEHSSTVCSTSPRAVLVPCEAEVLGGPPKEATQP
jgi:hypothetical protein